MIRYILLDPQGEFGGGKTAPDLAEALKTLLSEKHGGDAMAVARELLAKNRALESDNRKYRQKVGDLKKSLPEEGAVVLKGDDAKKWAKLRELGDPAEVKASLESGKVALQKLEGIGRAETFRKAALAAKYDPDVFAELAESKGITIEFAQETRDGKAVEAAFVTGEGNSRTPLGEYVESSLSKFLPALKQGQSPPLRDRSKDTTPPRRSSSPPPRLDDVDDDGLGLERELLSSGAYQT